MDAVCRDDDSGRMRLWTPSRPLRQDSTLSHSLVFLRRYEETQPEDEDSKEEASDPEKKEQ